MADGSDQRRSRSWSMLSFNGNKKHKRSPSFSKADLIETPQEKAAKRVTSKADPTKAINEVQPVAVALEKSTMESIRSIQHRDINGDIIADPDRSNPTRPRFERPLDTIRAFEAAIDGAHARRAFARTVSDHTGPQNRRSSYHQGYAARPRQQIENGGYYGNRFSLARPDSFIESYGATPSQYPGSRRLSQRLHSDPALPGQNNPPGYLSHGYQQSLDASGSSSANESHGTDQWGNFTDPSSENSSIDKVQQAPKPDLGEIYGFSGFGGAPQLQGPILEERGQGTSAYGQPGYGRSQGYIRGAHPSPGTEAAKEVPPSPPPHTPSKENIPRVPIKLGNSPLSTNTSPGVAGDKRKSWLKRRFSRS